MNADPAPARSASTAMGGGVFPSINLKCLASLRVGTPVFEQDRIARAPLHLLAHDGLQASFELQWRYPRGTFTHSPGAAGLENLFSLLTLLPLLNYLPFCREISVEGPVEPGDAEWLNGLSALVRSEIERSKLTPENPYLRAEALRDLSRDVLRPPEIRGSTARLPPLRWAPAEDRAAVLQDGSSEGLVSWAILQEVGARPLAVFFDRALHGMGASANAWRHFSAREPESTRRVWTNLPLLYDFLLRHLDFLRPNYQTIRADLPPIRIFEMEIYALAALPVLWASGIKHLALPHRGEGHERRQFGGTISPLPPFEQMRAFEDSVCRLFDRKGWRFEQWTLLRSTSPLIVQRTLAERYPELFPLQVECQRPRMEAPPPPHRPERFSRDGEEGESDGEGEVESLAFGEEAGEEESAGGERSAGIAETGGADRVDSRESAALESPGRRAKGREGEARLSPFELRSLERAIPCGACEPCRRLVAILKAVGRDPRELGYSQVKIERALAHVSRVSNLPPEAHVQRHVMYLLEKRRQEAAAPGAPPAPGGVSEAPQGGGEPRRPRYDPCPVVEALRFDRVRAPITAIPSVFRRAVYGILLRYASGAVRREGGEWRPFDLLSDPEIERAGPSRDPARSS